jgi:hypothetical protein
MNILDNELVLKYFKCKCYMPFDNIRKKHGPNMVDECKALKILTAMQQPIRKGEKYLYIGAIGGIVEAEAVADDNGPHTNMLRLPDEFQKQEKNAEDFPDCKKEEITWQGEFQGKKIIMTAHHVIWLEEKPALARKENKINTNCVCICHVQGYGGNCPQCSANH